MRQYPDSSGVRTSCGSTKISRLIDAVIPPAVGLVLPRPLLNAPGPGGHQDDVLSSLGAVVAHAEHRVSAAVAVERHGDGTSGVDLGAVVAVAGGQTGRGGHLEPARFDLRGVGVVPQGEVLDALRDASVSRPRVVHPHPVRDAVRGVVVVRAVAVAQIHPRLPVGPARDDAPGVLEVRGVGRRVGIGGGQVAVLTGEGVKPVLLPVPEQHGAGRGPAAVPPVQVGRETVENHGAGVRGVPRRRSSDRQGADAHCQDAKLNSKSHTVSSC